MEKGIDKKTDTELAKVLWVEDDETIIDSHVMEAEKYGLELKQYSNWEEAEKELNENFEEYSAIILDAYCKIRRGDSERKEFVAVVTGKLATIFERNHNLIPWYIYSAGTMDTFDVTKDIVKEIRGDFLDEWGDAVFLKNAIRGEREHREFLFQKIADIAKQKDLNSVLYRHKDVFKYLGKDRLINSSEARKLMKNMFRALYNLEVKEDCNGNSLRKVLEHLFEAAKEKGLLPQETLSPANASRFMAGQTIEVGEDKKKVRWGEDGEDGKSGDHIFEPFTVHYIQNILNYSNTESHSKKDSDFVSETGREEFFGLLFLLSHVIKEFAKYVENHPDSEENRKNIKSIDDKDKSDKKVKIAEVEFTKHTPENIIGREFPVIRGENCWYAGSCKLSSEYESAVKVETKVTIDEVKENPDKDKKRYPFIATKITPLGD